LRTLMLIVNRLLRLNGRSLVIEGVVKMENIKIRIATLIVGLFNSFAD